MTTCRKTCMTKTNQYYNSEQNTFHERAVRIAHQMKDSAFGDCKMLKSDWMPIVVHVIIITWSVLQLLFC